MCRWQQHFVTVKLRQRRFCGAIKTWFENFGETSSALNCKIVFSKSEMLYIELIAHNVFSVFFNETCKTLFNICELSEISRFPIPGRKQIIRRRFVK